MHRTDSVDWYTTLKSGDRGLGGEGGKRPKVIKVLGDQLVRSN